MCCAAVLNLLSEAHQLACVWTTLWEPAGHALHVGVTIGARFAAITGGRLKQRGTLIDPQHAWVLEIIVL
jgi:hypothetical protein